MAAGLCLTVIARIVRAFFCRVQAPGNPAGHFFVAGRFDKVFSKILKIARFGLGIFLPESSLGKSPAQSWIARTGCWAPDRAFDNFPPKIDDGTSN